MAPTGRSLTTVALFAVAAVLFVPVFYEAAAGFSYGSWKYGPYVQTALDALPILLGAGAILLLAGPITEAFEQ